MLVLNIENDTFFDEEKNKFIDTPNGVVMLEHSLVSLSKWESKYKKPFLTKTEKTQEETLGYILSMEVSSNNAENWLSKLTLDDFDKINAYIEDSMTATTIADKGGAPNREIITSELIYYWMTAFNIPWEAQHWHLSRLLTLIQVCGVKNKPPKKMNKADAARQRRSINAQRRAKYGSRG